VLARRFAVLLALIAVLGISLAAQGNPAASASADVRLTGVVRTAEGTSVPGSTLRVVQTSTGKAWVSWTDENGKFDLPGLPVGHYRIELSQLGFAPATKEIDLISALSAPIELKLDVGTLAAISAPPASQPPAKELSASHETSKEAAKAEPSSAVRANSSATASADSTAANSGEASSAGRRPGGGYGQGGARNGQQGGFGGARQGQSSPGGGRRAFQQVGLNGQDPNSGDTTAEEQQNPQESGGPLGQAASADAVQMIGTVTMGVAQDPAGGPGRPGDGGPDTQAVFGYSSFPGETPQGGFPGQGGPGGGGFGGPGGGAVFIPRGGGGGRGPGQRGPDGPRPQGIEGLMGVQRVMRQRINCCSNVKMSP
jgi:hypothetical protein